MTIYAMLRFIRKNDSDLNIGIAEYLLHQHKMGRFELQDLFYMYEEFMQDIIKHLTLVRE